ncbi:phage tail tape measure protein [Streptomyces sp. NPDC056159]|uniref:phage tail tape measure protein n=1 Tax=Streptomyces sp. NPDC056159 TaxID=3155537 RepID=UPI003414CCC7
MAGGQRTLRVVIVGNADSAEKAVKLLGDAADDSGKRFDGFGSKLEGMGGKLKGLGAALVAGLAIGGIADQFSKGLDEIANRARTAASMGLTGEDAAKAGKVAGELYTKGFGESTADTGDLVRRITQDMNMSIDDVDFQPIAGKVATLSKVMDEDIGAVTRGVSNLMRNGLAKNADEALDIVAAGFTKGVDKSEDLLYTLNEYGTQFRNMGLSGEQAMGMLSQGLQAGARDADVVADAIKEFSIEAVAGSDKIRGGYKELGLNADKMFAKIGKGGKSATDALGETLDELRKVKDPVERNAIAVELFGTKAEDLGDALYALDPKTAVKSLGEVGGAADKMADTMQNNAAAKVERFKRRVEMGFTNFSASTVMALDGLKDKLGPVFERIGEAAAPFVQGLKDIGGRIRTSFETGAARKALEQLGKKLREIWDVAGPALQDFAAFFRGTLIPLFQDLWTKAQPILLQLWETIKTYLEFIKVTISGFVDIVKWLWSTFGDSILEYVRTAWDAVSRIISGVLDVIQGVYEIFMGVFTGDWSRAWEGIKQVFSGIWDVIAGLFDLVLANLKLALSTAMTALKGVWNKTWEAVSSYFSDKWSEIYDYFSKKLGDLKTAASLGVDAVKKFFTDGFKSLVSTVKDKLGDAVAAVKEVPGKVKDALSKLPGEMLTIGKNIIQGLVDGIKNSLGNVMSAAQSIVDKIPGPIKRAMGIHSPSKVMEQIGKWITEGLVKGMLGGSKKVSDTSKKLHEQITKAFNAKKISKKKADSLHKYVSQQNVKLLKLAKEREKVAAALKVAQAKLNDLKKAKADMASGISGKARDFGSFSSAFDLSEYGDNSASAVLARLKGKLQGIVNFRKNLNTLASRGLGKGIIAELAQAGPDEGGQMAQALLNATGSQIKEMNSTFSAIGKESDALGNKVAGDYYKSGIQAAEGLVKGLKAKESKLTKAITDLANKMVKTLKKKLGIKSPSRVFRTQGQFTGEGFALGVEDEQNRVQDAVNALAATRPTGRLANRSIGRESALRAAGASAPTVHVTVQGNVTSEKALAKSIASTIRDEIVRTGKRNGGRTGL